jgi:hypothetical protein
MQMRLVILAAAIFFEFSAYARATAILAVWYPDFVFIGADGREFPSNGPPVDACKTSVVGDFAVAEAGWLQFGDKDIAINIDALIRGELNKDGLPADRVAHAETIVFDTFKNWQNNQAKAPGAMPLDPQSFGAEILFTYGEGGAMVADFYTVKLDESNRLIHPIIHCPSAECGVGTAISLGHHEEILRILHSDPAIINHTMPKISDRIRYTIQKVSTQIPSFVGGSISILKVTPDGKHEWIDKGNCGDN